MERLPWPVVSPEGNTGQNLAKGQWFTEAPIPYIKYLKLLFKNWEVLLNFMTADFFIYLNYFYRNSGIPNYPIAETIIEWKLPWAWPFLLFSFPFFFPPVF